MGLRDVRTTLRVAPYAGLIVRPLTAAIAIAPYTMEMLKVKDPIDLVAVMEANKPWYLRQNRLFAGASELAIANAERLFTMALLPKRAMIFGQGDDARSLYLLRRGNVRLSRCTVDGKEITIAVLGPGDIFGEEALFADGPRTTTASCVEETLLCRARADDLIGLLEREPTLAINVARILSDRLGDASAALEDLAYARVADRILHLFTRLAQEHGERAAVGVRLDIRLTHADIASLIGSTRETVSLELANLVRTGRIALDGRDVIMPLGDVQM